MKNYRVWWKESNGSIQRVDMSAPNLDAVEEYVENEGHELIQIDRG